MLIGVCLLFLILGVVFLSGRGAFLIAGYNTMSKERKSQYNEKALCRAVGVMMLGMSLALVLLQLSTTQSIPTLNLIGTILIFIIPIGGILYLNFGNRFLLEGAVAVSTNGANLSSKIGMFIAFIVMIGVSLLFIVGSQDPTVKIDNGVMRISGMYGRTIDLSEVNQIALLDETMREIGAGRRNNGFGGINAWKGHFTAGLLFVQANSAPTLLIEREEGQDIFISFRDSEETIRLFEQLQIAIGE